MDSPFLSVNLNKLVGLMQIKAEILLKKDYNIDYSQFLILHMITVIDDPNQQDIARHIGYTGAGVSKITDILKEKKLLTKIADPLNRRSNRIVLTESGEHLIHLARQSLEDKFDTYISPDDKKIMFQITDRVITRLS